MPRIARWAAGIALVLPLAYLPAAGQDDGGESELKLAPLQQVALDRYLNALNHQDRNAYFKTYHFPIVELDAGRVRLYKDRSEIPSQVFEFLPLGWFKTQFVSQRVVQKDRNKIHVLVRVANLDKNGKSLGEYDQLFILTKPGGSWGIQVRSSFPTELPEETVRAPF
jgi:hypothetical protein